jgi:hypothetical protein
VLIRLRNKQQIPGGDKIREEKEEAMKNDNVYRPDSKP